MPSTSQSAAKHDPLAHASAVPDVSALITEFGIAQQSGACHIGNIGASEDVRFNRWDGKSPVPDGCRWQVNSPQGKIVRPYDGRPDTDVQLADEICAAEVDILLTAYAMSQIGVDTTHVTPMTAADKSEFTAVARWVQKGVRKDLRNNNELLAQMMATLGWSVLNPGWLERHELVIRTIDREALIVKSMEAPEGSLAANIPELIRNPQYEKSAIEVVQMFYPNLDADKARQVVRDLRTNGTAEFLDKQVAEKRPTIRTLIQGYNFFVAGATGELQKARGCLVIERFFQADLESTAASNGWNPEFIEAAKATAGMFSAYGAGMQEKTAAQEDSADRSIEIWTTYIKQYDPDTGAAGIYCTTFSPHVSPSGEATAADYAHHYLLDYAHGEFPFIQARREVIGPSLDDSRGVPEMVQSDQKVIKSLQDATVARTHLEVNPPRAFFGAGWSKTSEADLPGGRVTSVYPGSEIVDLAPKTGNGQMGENTIARLEMGTRRRFALPNNTDGSHPSAWQMRQTRATGRFLAAHEDALWQMCILAYQNLDEIELGEIIGRPPALTVERLMKQVVMLKFDPRALDQEWTKTVLEFVIKLLGIDSGGLMDRGPIIQIALSHIDPTIVQSIMRSPEGASAALYRQVEQNVSSIMLGNPPQLAENDASAGMQIQMVYAVMGKNPDYQQRLKNDERVKANLETYLENLQHNVQETQLSPQQGRLGVKESPEKPVQQGAY